MSAYGLIGYPLQHTHSPKLFREIFDRNASDDRYKVIETQTIDNLREIIAQHHLKGFNVTCPFKTFIAPQLDALDELAEIVGAVNTVRVTDDGNAVFLKGYNTDVDGFDMLFQQVRKAFAGRNIRALILGTGGASRAVQHVLRKYGVGFYLVSRKLPKPRQIQYGQLSEQMIKRFNLIVNATPLGMHPNENEYPPLPYEYLTKEHCLVDLIYNPSETLFLKHGIEKGCTTFNGMEMLCQQAETAFRIWTGRDDKRLFRFPF